MGIATNTMRAHSETYFQSQEARGAIGLVVGQAFAERASTLGAGFLKPSWRDLCLVSRAAPFLIASAGGRLRRARSAKIMCVLWLRFKFSMVANDRDPAHFCA